MLTSLDYLVQAQDVYLEVPLRAIYYQCLYILTFHLLFSNEN